MSSFRGIPLNCGLRPPPATTSCHTPNTPEILNAIVNISFPTPPPASQPPTFPMPVSSLAYPPAPQALLPPQQPPPLPSPCYSDCSTASSSGPSPLASPTGPNTVQHIQSQFIKEGLKMKVRQKLKTEPEEGGAFGSEYDGLKIKKEVEDLTPEDEERRRRRRERNKVAATKCRNKKKEKTVVLVAESEIVEVQNASLKAEVARLDAEKRRLTSILAQHEPNCNKKRRRMCSGSEEQAGGGREEQYDMSHTFRLPQAPGAERGQGGLGAGQEQGFPGYTTNRPALQPTEEEEEELEEGFKSEAKDYKYSSGEIYEAYNLMRQPQLPDYASSRTFSYAGGYYDSMCLAL